MSCEQHRDAMVAFVNGELAGLPEQHMRTHLARCASCAAFSAELGRSLVAARAYAPSASSEHLAYLDARLSPYIEAASARRMERRWRPAVVAAGAACAAGVASLVWFLLVGAHLAPPAPVDGGGISLEEQAIAAALANYKLGEVAAPDIDALGSGGVRAFAPSAFVRAVATREWDGVTRAAGGRLEIEMHKGAVGLAFTGGEDRSLIVATPLGEVRAIGTRFALALEGDAGAARLSVAVSEGKVSVTSARGRSFVQAGEEKRYAGETELSVSAAHPVLWALLAHAGLSARPERRVGKAARFARQAAPDLVAQLEAAEALAREGKAREALRIYNACLAQQGRANPGYADLCRYEMARLLGLSLNRQDAARRILVQLAERDHGEVGRQAALAVCELDRAGAPCAAAACLRRIIAAAGSEELRQEAEQLRARWQLDERRCGADAALGPAQQER